ncbi:hypothetical protein WA158_007542 [Blastocystis sp. Blastoise]
MEKSINSQPSILSFCCKENNIIIQLSSESLQLYPNSLFSKVYHNQKSDSRGIFHIDVSESYLIEASYVMKNEIIPLINYEEDEEFTALIDGLKEFSVPIPPYITRRMMSDKTKHLPYCEIKEDEVDQLSTSNTESTVDTNDNIEFSREDSEWNLSEFAKNAQENLWKQMEQLEMSIKEQSPLNSPECNSEISLENDNHDNYESIVFPSSTILNKNIEYDLCQILHNNNNTWKMLFRASEHNFSATEFHQICDNHSNLLVLVKSINNNIPCIFGGYTKVGWNTTKLNELFGDYKTIQDEDAFVFTLQNPHNVPPTCYHYIGQLDSLAYDPHWGPIFSSCFCICDQCNQYNKSSIDNDSMNIHTNYEWDNIYKSSLFVDTNDKTKDNFFFVDEYEIFVKQ